MSATPETLPRRHFLGRLLAAWAGSAWLSRLFEPRESEASTQLDDTPYVGEIRMFAGSVAPQDWMLCEGQLLDPNASQYQALYNLIGTTYGGDGISTFALPDLRGKAPVHVGPGYALGQMSGFEQVTLATTQIPSHAHNGGGSGAPGTTADPTGHVLARNAAGVPAYGVTSNTDLAPSAMLSTGGSQSHSNMQPYVSINFILSIIGVFPSQS